MSDDEDDPIEIFNRMTPEERAVYGRRFGQQFASHMAHRTGTPKPKDAVDVDEQTKGIIDRMMGFSGSSGMPRRVADLPAFPLKSFADFKRFTKARLFVVYRTGIYTPNAFRHCAGPVAHFFHALSMLLIWLSIPVALLSAFLLSPWWGILAILVPVGFWLHRKTYNATILAACWRNESMFCWLYSNRQIAVFDPELRRTYSW